MLYGKQLHPDQLRTALGTTAPAPPAPAPAPAAVGIGPTGTHHTQQQRIMVRRVTRRSVLVTNVALCLLKATCPEYVLTASAHIQDWNATVRPPYSDPVSFHADSHTHTHTHITKIPTVLCQTSFSGTVA